MQGKAVKQQKKRMEKKRTKVILFYNDFLRK